MSRKCFFFCFFLHPIVYRRRPSSSSRRCSCLEQSTWTRTRPVRTFRKRTPVPSEDHLYSVVVRPINVLARIKTVYRKTQIGLSILWAGLTGVPIFASKRPKVNVTEGQRTLKWRLLVYVQYICICVWRIARCQSATLPTAQFAQCIGFVLGVVRTRRAATYISSQNCCIAVLKVLASSALLDCTRVDVRLTAADQPNCHDYSLSDNDDITRAYLYPPRT